MVPLGVKPLSEPVMGRIYVAIWHHWTAMWRNDCHFRDNLLNLLSSIMLIAFWYHFHLNCFQRVGVDNISSPHARTNDVLVCWRIYAYSGLRITHICVNKSVDAPSPAFCQQVIFLNESYCILIQMLKFVHMGSAVLSMRWLRTWLGAEHSTLVLPYCIHAVLTLYVWADAHRNVIAESK